MTPVVNVIAVRIGPTYAVCKKFDLYQSVTTATTTTTTTTTTTAITTASGVGRCQKVGGGGGKEPYINELYLDIWLFTNSHLCQFIEIVHKIMNWYMKNAI